jgi:hypothetical protein
MGSPAERRCLDLVASATFSLVEMPSHGTREADDVSDAWQRPCGKRVEIVVSYLFLGRAEIS